jgi:WD40 repeat protein
MMSEVLIEISTDNKIYTISRHNEKELKVFALNSSDYYKGITIDYCKTECFTVSQNNSMIASAYSNKKIIIHLLPDMIDYFILQSHEAQIEMLLFTSDFSQLISGGVDSYLLVWSLSSRALFKKINLKIGGYQLEPLNCNHLLISGYDNDLRIINIEDGNSQSLLDNHHDEVTVIALSKSLSFLATGGHDYNIFIWNTHDLSFLRISNAHDGCIRCLNFTQNEDYLLSQGGDCLIKMWKRANMELVRYFECQMNFEQIFVGRDDSMLVAYKEFSNIKIWDLGKGRTYELLNSDSLGYIYSITKNKMYMVFIKINLYIVCKFSYIEN